MMRREFFACIPLERRKKRPTKLPWYTVAVANSRFNSLLSGSSSLDLREVDTKNHAK